MHLSDFKLIISTVIISNNKNFTCSCHTQT